MGISFYWLTSIAVRRPIRQTSDQPTPDHRRTSDPRRTARRNLFACKRISQACGHFHWQGPSWCGRYGSTSSRVSCTLGKCDYNPESVFRPEDDTSREKALQTVVAGQQAENLLDFDTEEPSTNGESHLRNNAFSSDGMISNQAIASAAKSVNPLDELMDLFSTASMNVPTGQLSGGMGFSTSSSPAPPPLVQQQVAHAVQTGKAGQEDLLGLF